MFPCGETIAGRPFMVTVGLGACFSHHLQDVFLYDLPVDGRTYGKRQGRLRGLVTDGAVFAGLVVAKPGNNVDIVIMRFVGYRDRITE